MGFWGLSCVGPGTGLNGPRESLPIQGTLWFCDPSPHQCKKDFFFTAQAGACQVLRHSCPVCLYPQMKEIHQQVGPQSQHCWDMNPLSSVIKREQIPVHPFTQDLTSRMLHGVDWANQTLRWNPRGGFAVGGFHRRLQLGERFNKPTKLLTLRNRTHPGETGWNTVALGKELLRDSYCQNFVLFII